MTKYIHGHGICEVWMTEGDDNPKQAADVYVHITGRQSQCRGYGSVVVFVNPLVAFEVLEKFNE